MDTTPPPENGQANLMSFRLQIPNALVGAVIGKQGETIKSIREQTLAKVTIADSQLGEDRDLTLKGQPQSIEQALNLIINHIAQVRLPSFSPDQSEESLSIKVLVANDQAGAIIGKGGEVIKQMREESGARISIGKKVDFVRVITLVGTSAALRSALTILVRLVRDHPSSARNPFLHGFRAQPNTFHMNPATIPYQSNAQFVQHPQAVATLLEPSVFSNDPPVTLTINVPNRYETNMFLYFQKQILKITNHKSFFF
jgi:predicted RNA-binding protein YlqC (UPF0109 family)